MKLLLTGANGYIGTRLIPLLLEKGHEVVCLVRDKDYFEKQFAYANKVTLLTGDLLREKSIEPLPDDIDAAYYLMHSMNQTSGFAGLEALAAQNFVQALNLTHCKQVIFVNQLDHHSSDPLLSRRHIEEILAEAQAALTVIKSAMIIGADSIALEMLKGLTKEKNMVLAKRWTEVKVQPIAIADLLFYLEAILLRKDSYNQSFELGGPEVIPFKKLVITYAAICKQKISITAMPYVLSQLSAYWLNFLTPFNYSLASNLIESLKNDSICTDCSIKDIFPHKCLTYKEALQQAV
jgi:uncharacterized protein YbjT (DUF2867 family)